MTRYAKVPDDGRLVKKTKTFPPSFSCIEELSLWLVFQRTVTFFKRHPMVSFDIYDINHFKSTVTYSCNMHFFNFSTIKNSQ